MTHGRLAYTASTSTIYVRYSVCFIAWR